MRKSIVLILTVMCLNGCTALTASAIGASAIGSAAAGFGQGAAQAIFGDSNEE